jgi:hypothetical protein
MKDGFPDYDAPVFNDGGNKTGSAVIFILLLLLFLRFLIFVKINIFSLDYEISSTN